MFGLLMNIKTFEVGQNLFLHYNIDKAFEDDVNK